MMSSWIIMNHHSNQRGWVKSNRWQDLNEHFGPNRIEIVRLLLLQCIWPELRIWSVSHKKTIETSILMHFDQDLQSLWAERIQLRNQSITDCTKARNIHFGIFWDDLLQIQHFWPQWWNFQVLKTRRYEQRLYLESVLSGSIRRISGSTPSSWDRRIPDALPRPRETSETFWNPPVASWWDSSPARLSKRTQAST